MAGCVPFKCEGCKISETYKYWNDKPTATNKYHFISKLSSYSSIPKKFMEFFRGEELEGWWTLRGPSGKEWRVKLERGTTAGDTASFKEGWGTFLRDHGISYSNLPQNSPPPIPFLHAESRGSLLCTYAGNSTFDVLVLDSTGCESESAHYATNSALAGTNNTACSSSLHARPNSNNNNNNVWNKKSHKRKPPNSNNNNNVSNKKPRARKQKRSNEVIVCD